MVHHAVLLAEEVRNEAGAVHREEVRTEAEEEVAMDHEEEACEDLRRLDGMVGVGAVVVDEVAPCKVHRLMVVAPLLQGTTTTTISTANNNTWLHLAISHHTEEGLRHPAPWLSAKPLKWTTVLARPQ